MIRHLVTAAAVVAAFGCASCSNDGSRSPDKAPVLSVATKQKLGQYLVADGRTLYMYPPDKQRKVTCTKAYACTQAWPPLFVTAGQHAVAGHGLNQQLVGSLPGDGGQIVTYNNWPLYYYEGDRKAGQVNGQDQSFDWFVLGPQGNPIHTGPLTTHY